MSRVKKSTKNVAGPVLRRVRAGLELSQDELAARCQRMGWSIARDTVTRIEGGKRLVSDYELLILARALGVPVTCLFPAVEDLSPFLEGLVENEPARFAGRTAGAQKSHRAQGAAGRESRDRNQKAAGRAV
jgi:transcriptional regulator with XRE-family HTH domain